MVEHSLGRHICLPDWKQLGANRPNSGKANGLRGPYANPEPSPDNREGVEARRAAPKDRKVTVKGWSSLQTEMGRESGSGMKGEVDSSILSGSTTSFQRHPQDE